jgi:sugar phosphate isomerase/epimerase
MLSRRNLLKGAAATGSWALWRTSAAATKSHLGLQFFTFNGLASSGWEGFSKAMGVAHDIGYESLELAGLAGQPLDTIKTRARQLKLQFHSFHMGNDQVRAARQPGQSIPDVQDKVYTPDGVLEVARINLPIAKALGCHWGVIGAAGRSNFISAVSLMKLCDAFNAANKLARAMQLGLSYHTHPTDFKAVDGMVPFDFMIEHTDPSICYQIDVCWAAAAGADPAELIERHHDRIVSLHLKDLAANRTESATPGDGVLDFAAIRKASMKLRAPLFYVERDGGPNVDSVLEARKAFDFLTHHGW